MTVDLDKLEARASAATRGPWRHGNVERYHVFVPHSDGLGTERVLLKMNTHFDQHEIDARFIAAVSPDVVLALVAEVRQLRASLDRADDHVDEHWKRQDAEITKLRARVAELERGLASVIDIEPDDCDDIDCHPGVPMQRPSHLCPRCDVFDRARKTLGGGR